MGWTPRAPGWRVGQHEKSIEAIDRFAAAYEAYLSEPGLGRRTEAEALVVRAAVACDRVGAIPGHAQLDRWGIGSLAFLHEDPGVRVPVSRTSGPVRRALEQARRQYGERIEHEQRKRRNPLRWLVFGVVLILTVPAQLLGLLIPKRSGEVPVPLVVIAAVVSFVAVAGITVGLLD